MDLMAYLEIKVAIPSVNQAQVQFELVTYSKNPLAKALAKI